MRCAVDIVPMSDADLAEVLALLERSGLPTIGVEEHIAGFLVARSNGGVVGSAAIESYGASGLLRSVAVAPAQRRAGMGTSLVSQALAKAAREGVRTFYLLTTTAAPYFERFGFVICARDQAPEAIRGSWEFRTGCPTSATLMRCP